MGPQIRLLVCFATFTILLSGCAGRGAGSQSMQNPSGVTGAPTISMTVAPAAVMQGQVATLKWHSSGANSVTIDNGVGVVPLNGSKQITPQSTVVYHATASGPGGTASAMATVKVNPAISINFTAAPASIVAGATSTLTWSSQNATAVAIQGLGSFGPSGSVSVTPAATTTYTATATSPGGSLSATAIVTVAPTSPHIFLLVEENHSFSQVIGSSQMPYFNGLAKSYGLATQYFANFHPSLPNYFELTVGSKVSGNEAFSGTVTADNIVRELLAAGKTWKSYAEDIPSVGYLGPSVFPYTRDHNPFAYFSDVVNSSTQPANLVPFTQLAADYSSSQLPDFGFILPNEVHNCHDGNLRSADDWLKTNIAPLLASPEFQQSGILIIVFDESIPSDTAMHGGHVAAVIIGPTVKPGIQVSTVFQHQSTLRLILQKLGVTTFPGDAATAPDMNAFFQ